MLLRQNAVVTSTQKKQPGGRKLLLDLVFTLIIPISILSPDLLGSGFSVADALGGGAAGNVRAYLLAALIPVVYVLTDFILHRSLSPVAVFGGVTALVNGALAFWLVDGWRYALKDSALRFLIAAVAVASVYARVPLFRIFLDAGSMSAKPEERDALNTVMGEPSVVRSLGAGTLVFAGMEFVAGVVNYVVNLNIVSADFGSKAFNAQVAQANAVMRLPSIILFLGGFALAAWVVQRAVTARYGKGASVFEPAQLVEKVREEKNGTPSRAGA